MYREKKWGKKRLENLDESEMKRMGCKGKKKKKENAKVRKFVVGCIWCWHH